MPIRFNSNNTAGIERSLRVNNRDLAVRLERLSSALRVNRAADDAAGLAISEGLRAQIAGATQGVRNAELAVNLVQQAEGTLNQTQDILVRLRELAVQASSGGLTDANRAAIQAEFSQLTAEIDRQAQTTPEGPQTFQVDADAGAAGQVEIDLPALQASGPALNVAAQSVASAQGAQQAISAVDNAISQVSARRGDIGALQNRLGFAARANEQALVNAQASESTLRDADVALEITALARSRILTRAGTALFAQQNVNRQRVLDLLGR